MQLSAIILALTSGLLATAAPLESRSAPLADFKLSTVGFTCPLPTFPAPHHFKVNRGHACGECKSVTGNSTFKAVDVLGIHPKCTITLFQKSDCSDPGIVSGKGCWTPDGGIGAYVVKCDAWIDDGGLPPCNH